MLRHSRFEPEEIDREKGVIIEEMNMYFDTPRDFIGGYDELLYGDQPLGWDIIGTKETVRGATRETFLDYLGRWYKPERIVVGVGGRLEGDLLARLEELGRTFEAGRDGRPDRVDRPRTADRACRAHEAVRPGAHLLGVRSYPLVHPDRYALQLLATVLGGGMSSRLFTEVRERRGLAYYVFGTTTATPTPARSTRRPASTSTASTRPSRRSCRAAADRRRAGAGRRAGEGAQLRQGGRFVLQLESPHGTIMFGLAARCSRAGDRAAEVLAGLDAVTAEDIQRVAQDVIGRNALNLAVIGPFDDAERFEKILTARGQSARAG